MKERIVLIGYRGVGKTTVGRCLATLYGFDFLDTDEEIARVSGLSVREIVARDGWERFRLLEKKVLLTLPAMHRLVVATGGGAILHDPGIWGKIAVQSLIVWLHADVAVLQQRLAGDPVTGLQRPSLTGSTVQDEICQVLQERIPLYRELAHLEIDTTMLSIAEIADRIKAYENKKKS